MEETLRLVFRNATGKTVTKTIKDPSENLAAEDVEEAMDLIISTDVFDSTGGSLVEKIRAEVVAREVTTVLEY
ncbi:MAG: DUF2922 domain-containing protein [Firmicutes bacterium]|nr:DUF2922 domain-containing protein [Bacillota bacterium]